MNDDPRAKLFTRREHHARRTSVFDENPRHRRSASDRGTELHRQVRALAGHRVHAAVYVKDARTLHMRDHI